MRLVPEKLWDLVEPLLPRFNPRPQGGGTQPADQRAVIDAASVRATKGAI
jgi:hypothetical protein